MLQNCMPARLRIKASQHNKDFKHVTLNTHIFWLLACLFQYHSWCSLTPNNLQLRGLNAFHLFKQT